jgi:hypothetical protein
VFTFFAHKNEESLLMAELVIEMWLGFQAA